MPCQPLTLPHCVVRVLHRQFWERRGPSRTECLVERGELTPHHARGPAIGDDVMERHDKPMLLLPEMQQPRSQKWTTRQIERPRQGVLRPAPYFDFALRRCHGGSMLLVSRA